MTSWNAFLLHIGTFRAQDQGDWPRRWRFLRVPVHGAHNAGARLAFGAHLKPRDFREFVKPEDAGEFFCPAAPTGAPCPEDAASSEGHGACIGVGVDKVVGGGEVGARPVGCEEVKVGADGVWAEEEGGGGVGAGGWVVEDGDLGGGGEVGEEGERGCGCGEGLEESAG